MSHSESYLNIEAIRQKGGIKKSEDDRLKGERIRMESNGVESKAKRKYIVVSRSEVQFHEVPSVF